MKNFKDGDATKDPFMSPLLAPDEMLSGLPPVHIVVSSMASLCFLSPWKKSKRVELADIQLLANSYAAARITVVKVQGQGKLCSAPVIIFA